MRRSLRWIVTMALCRCAFGRELRERYKEMAEMYWRCNSAPVSCAGQLDHYERGKFFTVGLEGFGHHAFFHTPKSLGATGGGARSYPFGFTWRNEGYASIPASYRGPDLPELLMQNKLLVLVRDLVDAHFSTVRRFWKEKTRLLDSLDLELRAAIDNLRLMRDTVGNVSCAQKFYLPYELLSGLENDPPDPLVMDLLRRFFNTTSKEGAEEDLQEWVTRIKVGGSFAEPRFLNCSSEKFASFEKNLKKFASNRFDNTSQSSYVAQYRVQLQHFYYKELLPSQPDLYDLAPARPMTFCLPGT